jgi:hypothetical protein
MVAEVKEFADAGGLMTYGPSEAWLSGRLVVVVAHVDSEHALQMRPVQDEKQSRHSVRTVRSRTCWPVRWSTATAWEPRQHQRGRHPVDDRRPRDHPPGDATSDTDVLVLPADRLRTC